MLVPLQCEFFALEGISQLMRTIELVRRGLNPALDLQGIVLTMFDRRNNLSDLVAADARGFFGDRVYDTVIPRNIRISEAPSHGKPVLLYDFRSAGAQAYIHLAAELLRRERSQQGASSMSAKDAGPRLGRGLAALMGEAAARPEPPAAQPGIRAIGDRHAATRPVPAARPDGRRRPGRAGRLDPRPRRAAAAAGARRIPRRPGHYQIIAGERRWRAAGAAGLHEVPALVRALSDSDAMAAALVENLQREDLNPIEEAEGYARLRDEFGMTQEALAAGHRQVARPCRQHAAPAEPAGPRAGHGARRRAIGRPCPRAADPPGAGEGRRRGHRRQPDRSPDRGARQPQADPANRRARRPVDGADPTPTPPPWNRS